MRHCGPGLEVLVDFNAGKTQLVSFDQSNNTRAFDVKMDGSALEEKSSFEMLGLTFSSKLDWGSYIISIAKTASKKIGALIRSMKFLSPVVYEIMVRNSQNANRFREFANQKSLNLVKVRISGSFSE